MSKSVYSLVLTDQVVEEIDRLAYAMGKSRSALIDRLLAEYAGYITPEMRINSIFDSITALMGQQGGSFVVQPGDQSMVIRSSLKYKYKPSINYSLQLLRTDGHTEGQLKVSFRTQSEELKRKMGEFLRLWAALENKYIAEFFPAGIHYTITEGSFIRSFVLPKEYGEKSNDEIGEVISAYIRMFDDVLKCYFTGENDREAAEKAAAQYIQHLKNGITVI
ncbi:MAG: ribbon-helix-helix domain-containing protein [Firmicutes bacterium]|nr:ribbon-helix-helix domain-containing protein [[Eubacterium] siraeum]MCM1488451.1 ribbon-helix-helix domain-containing protein [Bacillota bacterium]